MLLACVVVGALFVAVMSFLDETGTSRLAFDGDAHVQSARLMVPFAIDPHVPSTRLFLSNAFDHGYTDVVLSHEPGVEHVVVELSVRTPTPLGAAIRLTNTSCSTPAAPSYYLPDPVPAPWATGGPCHGGGPRAQLNISAAPPAACVEQCSWSWLWAPCKCHAAANLTLILPSGVNANLTDLVAEYASTAALPYSLARSRNGHRAAMPATAPARSRLACSCPAWVALAATAMQPPCSQPPWPPPPCSQPRCPQPHSLSPMLPRCAGASSLSKSSRTRATTFSATPSSTWLCTRKAR